MSDAGEENQPARCRRGLCGAHVWAPLLVLAILAGPSLTFLLPATQDYLDEIYQPLQALKFFKSKGREFHKYGPMPNFVLAPGYGVSLAYWKVTGSFEKPSDKFPYGFERPFEQMGFLIFQGRLLFLVIALAGIGYLAHTLRLVTENRWAVGFAVLFCVATNYAVAQQIPSPRPDSPMLGFSAFALACYLRMVYLGLTVRRGVWFSLWAVFATSSKELAGPMFVLPFLGLIWLAWKTGDEQPGGRRGAERTIRYAFLAGVISYAMLNIVYAPGTWVQRMKFWLTGPGIDAEVWGKGDFASRVVGVLGCLLDNFGPGGVVVVILALLAYLLSSKRGSVMLMLPALSVAIIGLAKIQYPADRFYTILCLGLVPVVASGLDVVLSSRARTVAVAGMMLLAIVNIWFATFAWHALGGTFEYVAERHAVEHVDKSQKVHIFNTYPWNPGSTRLEHVGFTHDSRATQQIAAKGTNLPVWIYATTGKLQFLEDARKLPKRAEMIRKDSGFDVAQWAGLEGMGYRLQETIEPRTPGWFPFNWMPAVKQWKARRSVLVYHRAND